MLGSPSLVGVREEMVSGLSTLWRTKPSLAVWCAEGTGKGILGKGTA